jgi:hypothetical protein
MNCHLYLELSPELLAEPALLQPSLERLLAIGRVKHKQELFEVALCRAFGITQQRDWPIAPLSWLGEGNDPAGFYWLRADPVHLQLQRDHFSLSYPVPLALTAMEAESLLETLNRHFQQDGLNFFFGRTSSSHMGRWYLRLNEAPNIRTSLAMEVVGRDVTKFLPQGEHAAQWHHILNEMQMLLHEHPVNQAREANGELPVNSLWLSGGGVMLEKLMSDDKKNSKVIFTDNLLVKGMALATDLPCFDLPENTKALSNSAQEDVWLVMDNADDAESRWFAPLLAGLREGKIRQLSLNIALADSMLNVLIEPRDLWKFWRKPKSLKTCFELSSTW